MRTDNEIETHGRGRAYVSGMRNVRRLLIPLLLILGCADPPPPAPAGGLVIHGATLISPERDDGLDDAWVAIDEGRIVGVGAGAVDPAFAGSERFDAAGRYLTPGLIDAHVHLRSIPGLAAIEAAPPDLRSAVDRYIAQLPRSYLFFGFTTVIDLNVVDRAFVERIRSAPVGPDVLDCDGALVAAGSYPMVFVPAEARFDVYRNFLWDERFAAEIPPRFSADAHTPEAAVVRVVEAGGICVKTFHEDGFGPRAIWPTPVAETIDSVVDAARAEGLTVTMHANALSSYRYAAARRVDVVVHGLWTWEEATDLAPASDGAVPMPIGDVLDDLVRNEIAMMPTLRVIAGERALFDADFFADARLGDAVPAPLIDWYRTPAGRWYADALSADFGVADPAAMLQATGAVLDRGARALEAFQTRGGRLLFGSDTPSGPTYANPPGLNGRLEMDLWVAAGQTPSAILRAATLDNARAFGITADYGTVAVGKVANLLLLTDDPRRSVTAWDTIETVFVHGKASARRDLSARRAEP